MAIAIFAMVIFYIGNLQPVGNPDKFIQLFHGKMGKSEIPIFLQLLQNLQ